MNGFWSLSQPTDGPGWGTTMFCGPPNGLQSEDGIPASQWLGDCGAQALRIKQLDNGSLLTIPGISTTNMIGIEWGVGAPQSGLDFLFVTDVTVASSPFLIGILVHENFRIALNSVINITRITLDMIIDDVHLTNLSTTIFTVNETPNTPPCPFSITAQDVPCPDKVTGEFPSFTTIFTNTTSYQLELSFHETDDPNSPIIDFLSTEENALTPGFLFAQIVGMTTSQQTTVQQTTQEQTTQEQTTQEQTTAQQTTVQQITTVLQQTTQEQTTKQQTTTQQTTQAQTTAQQTTHLHTTQQQTTQQQTTAQQTTEQITTGSIPPPPIARNDCFILERNSVNNTLNVLLNDSFLVIPVNISSLAILPGFQPQYGTYFILKGVIVYTPDGNFTGEDNFRYIICDESGQCAEASVCIIIPPIPPPEACDDFYVIFEDSPPVNLNVLANDSAPGGFNFASIQIVRYPTNGIAVPVPSNGTINYQPNPNYYGFDTFRYSICDLYGQCVQANVVIKILSLPDMPIVNNETVILHHHFPFSPCHPRPKTRGILIDVLLNDTSIDSVLNPASLQIVRAPCFGVAVVTPTAMIFYSPFDGFFGEDSFSYQVCDEHIPPLCGVGVVTVIVEEECIYCAICEDLSGTFQYHIQLLKQAFPSP